MFPGAKLWLGLFSLVGFSSAVGIPLSFTSAGSQAQGGAPSRQFRVDKCVDNGNNLQQVNFGDNNAKEVCWTTSSDSGVTQVSQITNETKFSDLFTNKWSSPSTSWSSSGAGQGNEWRTNCWSGASYQFIIQSSGGQQSADPEYAGLCISDNSDEKQQYVSVEGKNQLTGNLTVKVCSGSSCWQTQNSTHTTREQSGGQEAGTTIHTLTSPASNGWIQIIFKKKS